MAATDTHEIEVKLRFDSVRPLAQAGMILELETARHFEDNFLLDTADEQLRQKMAILRVRRAGEAGSLTYKEKPASDAPATQFKQRLEIETALDDPAGALALFERLGFNSWFRYQKYRTVFRASLPGGATLHVMFDETPIGNFIELEGEENAIAEAVKLLGIEPKDYVLESYLALQAAHCQQQDKPLQDMTFSGD
ncbi:MAG TPA: class IV adenylate cyclase [Blastocatellia bacterium]|nr:class IV adenylate cyclase [Blastocatellia bacterium]HMY70360.1 class IV adenylate cyclase [Blastocatellia bacterium]HMZ18558.1 class IV adenylate cyclase [Blastocatellia bacterium]HNG28141.1 class IV adenylate cyclase [Blastocatellia bacterium]